MIPGLSVRIASGSIPVMRVHYSSDPQKRPGTPEGDHWLAQALSGYPGGESSPRWRREMDIQYNAYGGAKAFPDLARWKDLLFVAPFNPAGYTLYASYDHGWTNPAAYHVHGINGDGHRATFFEFYGSRVPYTQIARIIKGESVTLPDGRRFHGNPFAGQERWKVADPSIWSENVAQNNAPNKSMAQLFAQEGVYFMEGERGGDVTVVEWLTSRYWSDIEHPRYQITTDCPKLWWELTRLRHKEHSATVMLNSNTPEQLVDKDNHAWDGLKMFFRKFPPTPAEAKPEQRPNSFHWWRKVAKAAKEGQPVPTYRRELIS